MLKTNHSGFCFAKSLQPAVIAASGKKGRTLLRVTGSQSGRDFTHNFLVGLLRLLLAGLISLTIVKPKESIQTSRA
jgi:hypothetical protein